jgi:hypothetical protein
MLLTQGLKDVLHKIQDVR